MITVVGIGADGWDGLAPPARTALQTAATIVGASRQLALLPDEVRGERRPWPSPMAPLLDEVAVGALGPVTVLASGDPMLHGVGGSIVRRAGADAVTVIAHPSAFALACAALGWPQEDVELVSLVARSPHAITRSLQPGRRVIALVSGTDGAAACARVLVERGFGDAPLTVLEQLGGSAQRTTQTTAAAAVELVADPLHVVAVAVPPGHGHARTPGLDDEAYEHDGQLTKRHIRALTLATLAPCPGEHLWDVGAGAGSIAIEWLRAEPSVTATAFESVPERVQRIATNADTLGVPGLRVVSGRAPACLAEADPPDVIFVGGGITTGGLLDACWAALPLGGRLVANTVTLEGERAVVAARAQYSGTLARFDVAHAGAVGGFTAWRPQMTVVQWATHKETT